MQNFHFIEEKSRRPTTWRRTKLGAILLAAIAVQVLLTLLDPTACRVLYDGLHPGEGNPVPPRPLPDPVPPRPLPDRNVTALGYIRCGGTAMHLCGWQEEDSWHPPPQYLPRGSPNTTSCVPGPSRNYNYASALPPVYVNGGYPTRSTRQFENDKRILSGGARRPAVPKLFIIGDSHAATLHAALIQATQGIMDTSILYQWQSRQGHRNDRGENFREASVSILREIVRPGDAVLVSNRFCSRSICFIHPGNLGGHILYLTRLRAVISERGGTLFLLDDVPALPGDGKTCLLRQYAGRCSVPFSAFESSISPYRSALMQLESNMTHFAPYGHLMCTSRECNQYIPGTRTLGMYDKNHLTLHGALYMASFFQFVFLRWRQKLPWAVVKGDSFFPVCPGRF